MVPDLGNRRQPRFSVKDLTLSINGKSYRIFNINEFGVGFLIDSPTEITVGTEIKPVITHGDVPVRVTGIARHISQFSAPNKRLYFKTGWVCGTEFTTTRNDPGGNRLLLEFIFEHVAWDVGETEK
jgi:hypothetical protein